MSQGMLFNRSKQMLAVLLIVCGLFSISALSSKPTLAQAAGNAPAASLPLAFTKAYPTNAATAMLTSMSITWAGSGYATSYEYCIDTVNNNVCDTGWVSTGTNHNASLTGLIVNTTYFWQVRANNTAGTTYANASAWWSFQTKLVPP